MKYTILMLLCFLWCQTAIAAPREPATYKLETQTVGSDQTILRFINRTTGRTLWKKSVKNVDCVGWSHDHQALALSVYVGGKTPFRLLLWQAGKPLRVIDDSALPAVGEGFIDGVIDIVWSPDDRRVLYRVYQSGGKSLNNGRLYCLDTKSWRLALIPGNVRQMKWHKANEVWYRVVEYHAIDAKGTEQASFQWKKRNFGT